MRYGDNCGCSRASPLFNAIADIQERVMCPPYGYYYSSLIGAIEIAKFPAGYTVSTPRYPIYQLYSPVPKELNPCGGGGGSDRMRRLSHNLGGQGSNTIPAAMVFKHPIRNRPGTGHVHLPAAGDVFQPPLPKSSCDNSFRWTTDFVISGLDTSQGR